MTMQDFEGDIHRVSLAFAGYYYQLLTHDHAKLYQLYHKDAVLKHGEASNPFAKLPDEITGTDNVKKYWAKSKLGGAKVMLQSLECAHSANNSVLVIAGGELALQGKPDEVKPSHKFVQTFVLIPMGRKNLYDVYNDVLTFVPDVDDEIEEEEEEVEEEEEEEEDVEEETPVETAEETAEPVEVETPAETPASAVEETAGGTTATAAAAAQSKEVTPETTPEATPETVKEEKSEIKVEAAKADETTGETTEETVEETASEVTSEVEGEDGKENKDAPVKPTKGLSWANQIASSGIKSTSVARVPAHHLTVKGKLESSPGPAKKGSAKKKDAKKHAHHGESDSDDGFEKVSSSSDNKKLSSRQNSGVNKKGSTIFPIYVKGVDKVMTEAALTSALESSFGPVDSCRMDRAAAYVDFVDQDAQKKALATHLFRVGSVEVKLEARIKRDGSAGSKKKKSGSRKRHNNNGSAGAGNVNGGFTEDGFKRVGKR